MRKKRSSSSVLFLIIFGAIIAGVIYLYNSKMFERNLPVVTMTDSQYWNLKTPLDISIEDDSGLKFYEVKMLTSSGEKVLTHEALLTPQNKLELKVEYPKMGYGIKDKQIKIIITAVDASQWNFFSGNTAGFEKSFFVDKYLH